MRARTAQTLYTERTEGRWGGGGGRLADRNPGFTVFKFLSPLHHFTFLQSKDDWNTGQLHN